MIKLIGVTKRSHLMKLTSHALSMHWEFWQNLTVHALRALINRLFSEASSVITGSKITSGFALKAGLSSLWLLAGCWVQLQNGCMYFPDKSGIFPDIKTSKEFTDYFFTRMWEDFYVLLEILSLFSWWSSENVLLPFWGYLCCFKGLMTIVLLIIYTQRDWACLNPFLCPRSPTCLSVCGKALKELVAKGQGAFHGKENQTKGWGGQRISRCSGWCWGVSMWFGDGTCPCVGDNRLVGGYLQQRGPECGVG